MLVAQWLIYFPEQLVIMLLDAVDQFVLFYFLHFGQDFIATTQPKNVRLFEGVYVAELRVFYAWLCTIFAQFDRRIVIVAFVMKFETPREVVLLVDDLAEFVDLPIANEGVEKDADRKVPFEWDSIVLEPHLLKAVGAVLHDEAIKGSLDLLQADGHVVGSGQHHVQWPRVLVQADFFIIQSNLDGELSFPELSTEFVIYCLRIQSMTSLPKNGMLLGINL